MLNLKDARTIIDHLVALAAAEDLRVSCCVVDSAGNELATVRMDGAAWFTPGVARTKARTAAIMGRASGDLAGLRQAYPELLDLIDGQLPFTPTALPGGILIAFNDEVIGALGVSGALPEQDVSCAERAVTQWRTA